VNPQPGTKDLSDHPDRSDSWKLLYRTRRPAAVPGASGQRLDRWVLPALLLFCQASGPQAPPPPAAGQRRCPAAGGGHANGGPSWVLQAHHAARGVASHPASVATQVPILQGAWFRTRRPALDRYPSRKGRGLAPGVRRYAGSHPARGVGSYPASRCRVGASGQRLDRWVLPALLLFCQASGRQGSPPPAAGQRRCPAAGGGHANGGRRLGTPGSPRRKGRGLAPGVRR